MLAICPIGVRGAAGGPLQPVARVRPGQGKQRGCNNQDKFSAEHSSDERRSCVAMNFGRKWAEGLMVVGDGL